MTRPAEQKTPRAPSLSIVRWPTPAKAEAMILSGEVRVDGLRVDRPANAIPEHAG